MSDCILYLIDKNNGQGAIELSLDNAGQNNDMQTDIGAKLGLWGSAISTFGDALQTVGAAIAIEEARAADLLQQQQMEKLQNQIDDLKKGQTDMKTLTQLLEKIVDKLE